MITDSLQKIKKIPFYVMILAGMVLGFLYGYFLPEQVGWVAPLGTIFIKLLRMMVIPLVFISIVDGICRAGSIEKLSSLGCKSVVYYLTTNSLAVLTGLILVNLIKPGVGVTLFGNRPEQAVFTGHLFDVIPENIFRSFAQGDTLQIIFMAIVFGIGLVVLGDKAPSLRKAVSEANELFLGLTSRIILLAPVGIFGLMAVLAKSLDWTAFSGVMKFAVTILLGLLIHGGITLVIFFKMFSRRPLGRFFKNMQPALLTAFSTSSSSATLPVSFECIEKKEGISKEVAGFVLPVGATVNMDGTAIYEAVACLFIAQAMGIELSLSSQVVVFFTASLAAIGAASIPSAGLITLAIVLTAVNLPLEGIGFLLAFDRPLDMSRTVVNVWGDMVGCAILEEKVPRTAPDNPAEKEV